MHREDQFIPELIVHDGPAALDFYKSVFGAQEVHRIIKPDSEKIMQCVQTSNHHAQPFVWTATADSIFAKVQRLCEPISGTAH